MKKLLRVFNITIFLSVILFSGNIFSQEELPLPDESTSSTSEVTPPPQAPKSTSPAITTSPNSSSQEKVIYEYKKEDYFDFEALSVKGDLLTPGDLSGKTVKRVKFNSKEYIRKNFDDFIEDDLMEIY